jgi:hypothetical protein
MATQFSLPEDIRSYDEDHFILGTEDPDEMELDIDDIFAKDFGDVIRDGRRYNGADFFSPAGFSKHRPSDIVPEMTFVDFDGGTLLLDASGEPVGGYIESDLVLDWEWRGQGLGTELVTEHFLSHGSFPTWWLDSAAYSEAGYSTHLSAHCFPNRHRETYGKKLARHLLLDNADRFSEVVTEVGNEQVIEELGPLLLEGKWEDVSVRIENWLQARTSAPVASA